MRFLALFLLCSNLAAADLGLHYGYDQNVSQYYSFEQWLGRKVIYRVTFCGQSSWSDVTNPWPVAGGGTKAWLADPERVEVISVPLLLAGDSFTTDRAAEFKAFAVKVKQFGSRVIVRLGWEGNGDWYPWSFVNDPAGFVACFRRAVAAIKSVAQVRIEWNLSCKAPKVDWRAAYPGDDVVDIVSMDVYDSWNSGWPDLLGGRAGLTEFRAFCQSKGKAEAYTEWGCVTIAHGNGDSPIFVQNMKNWFDGGNVLYQSYWNTNDVGARIFGTVDVPAAAAKYRELFGTPAPTGLTIDAQP